MRKVVAARRDPRAPTGGRESEAAARAGHRERRERRAPVGGRGGEAAARAGRRERSGSPASPPPRLLLFFFTGDSEGVRDGDRWWTAIATG